MFQTENFDNHETRIIFLRARPLKKKIFAYNKRFLSVMSRTSNAIQNLSEATKSQEREKERGLSQHPVVCYFWPGNCGEVTSACSRFQNRGTKGRHENMTLVGAALLFAKLLMLHASLSLSLPRPSLPPSLFLVPLCVCRGCYYRNNYLLRGLFNVISHDTAWNVYTVR